MEWIKGFIGLSLIEYPGKVSVALFTGGCPFRCPFCHNRELVLDPSSLPTFSEAEVFKRLEARAGFCDAVVISGGEPLMHPKLETFVRRVKAMGFMVKLDTNGYYPEPLTRLLNEQLVDFVSMDLKTSIKKYRLACGVHVDWWRIEQSVSLLNRSLVDHEFRTTLVPGLVTLEDIPEMALILGPRAPWVLQPFRPFMTLDPTYASLQPYDQEALGQILDLAQSLKSNVKLRSDFNAGDKRFNQKVVSISA